MKTIQTQNTEYMFLISAKPEPQNISLDIIFEDKYNSCKQTCWNGCTSGFEPDQTLVNALLYHCKIFIRYWG